jgi:hypothetical protein
MPVLGPVTCKLRQRRALAVGPAAILLLAPLALLAQVLDLLTALGMIVQCGIDAEVNPLIRAAVVGAGPAGAAGIKLGGATAAVAVLLGLAKVGRVRLARNCLLLALGIGLVGVLSNGGVRALVLF